MAATTDTRAQLLSAATAVPFFCYTGRTIRKSVPVAAADGTGSSRAHADTLRYLAVAGQSERYCGRSRADSDGV